MHLTLFIGPYLLLMVVAPIHFEVNRSVGRRTEPCIFGDVELVPCLQMSLIGPAFALIGAR